jgi:hypothetical protein
MSGTVVRSGRRDRAEILKHWRWAREVCGGSHAVAHHRRRASGRAGVRIGGGGGSESDGTEGL